MIYVCWLVGLPKLTKPIFQFKFSYTYIHPLYPIPPPAHRPPTCPRLLLSSSPKIWKVHYLDNWPELNSSTILMRKVLTFPSLKHEDYVGGSYNWELQDSCNYCYFKGCVLPIVLVHFHNVRICIMDHIIFNLSAISYHRSLPIVPLSLHSIHFVLPICPLISNLSFHTLLSPPYHPL